MGHYAKRFFGQNNPLKVWYNFNGNTNDLSGNGLNGTLIGGATIINDRLNVTANNQSMGALDPTGIASFGSGAFTISCKVNVATITTFNWIANKRNDISLINNSKAEWQFYLDAGKIRLAIIDSSKSVNSAIGAFTNLPLLANRDYHIAVTFSGGVGNFFKIYVNGVQVAHTFTTTGAYESMRNNGSELRLGAIGWDASSPLLGSLDNFRLYNAELSAAEITILANE